MKYSHNQTKYIGKWIGLRTYQHPGTKLMAVMHANIIERNLYLKKEIHQSCTASSLLASPSTNVFELHSFRVLA